MNLRMAFPKVESRKEYMDFLATLMSTPEEEKVYEEEIEHRGRPRQLKTFIIESNSAISPEFSIGNFKCSIVGTDVPDIKILQMASGRMFVNFFLDMSDGRFWVLHTNALAKHAGKIMTRLIHSDEIKFDRTWFPTDMLKEIGDMAGNRFNGFKADYNDIFLTMDSPEVPVEELSINISGRSSYKYLEAIRLQQDLYNFIAYTRVRVIRGTPTNFAKDDFNYHGMFVVKGGTSIDDHISLVENARKKYREKIESIENFSIGVKEVEERTLIEGKAIDLEFKRTIDNWEVFLQRLLSHSFRLWGLKTKLDKDYYRVLAVDLHTGHPVDLEIAKNLMRIYLPKGSCGNVVLRLLVNLQHYFDSNIKCEELGIYGAND